MLIPVHFIYMCRCALKNEVYNNSSTSEYPSTSFTLDFVLACSFNQTAGPGVTIYDASKQHVHGKFHILSLESKFLETYLALEMSLNNA